MGRLNPRIRKKRETPRVWGVRKTYGSHADMKWWCLNNTFWYTCPGGGNSNILYFHRYLGKIPILTNIFFRWVETTNQMCVCILVHIPWTQLSSIFEGQPSKTTIRTGVIWILGIYIHNLYNYLHHKKDWSQPRWLEKTGPLSQEIPGFQPGIQPAENAEQTGSTGGQWPCGMRSHPTIHYRHDRVVWRACVETRQQCAKHSGPLYWWIWVLRVRKGRLNSPRHSSLLADLGLELPVVVESDSNSAKGTVIFGQYITIISLEACHNKQT